MKATAKTKTAKKTVRYTTEVGEHKGHPTIKITDNEARNPMFGSFMFGLSKAKMILGSIEAIREFVAENDKPEKE